MMEIRVKHKLRKMKVQDLEMMTLSLCYNEKTNDYEIFIRKPQGSAIVIQNASNCREIVILTCDKDQDILFAGKINNANIVDVEMYKEYEEFD